ncbi:transcription initiation factor TFIID subunit 14b-like isoform X2 [Olea europaea var. sylvestris]|uniref:transcription initiation factor TFIID subunit 14b-like isoform X2 n=1 Tax=Olea europaea var. sylvestris TaxID=158386 RepID=UPI000C1D0B10|nr:transcription initiation factor TFIID subunit 14b-like isoform X2 [Olea europaea var. sylvestris]
MRKRYQSHKWTVYVRSPTNEDLEVAIKQAVFLLLSTFNNPTRVVEGPFELSESGWGEFEIVITLHFDRDITVKPLHLWACSLCHACVRYHHLKLYPEEDSGPMSMKKPAVRKSYDEIVFSEPSEGFLARVQNQRAVIMPIDYPVALRCLLDIDGGERGDTKNNPLIQWFTNFSEAYELLKLAATRQQVKAHIARLRRQLSLIDGQQQLKSPSDTRRKIGSQIDSYI